MDVLLDYTKDKEKEIMNYKNKPEDIMGIIDDIEYLRKHKRYPWNGKNGRTAMADRFNYSRSFDDAKGHAVNVSIDTSVSCNYVRFSVDVEIDGERKARYMVPLKALA
jgi:hypothetical protein